MSSKQRLRARWMRRLKCPLPRHSWSNDNPRWMLQGGVGVGRFARFVAKSDILQNVCSAEVVIRTCIVRGFRGFAQLQDEFFCPICFENVRNVDGFAIEACEEQHLVCRQCTRSYIASYVKNGGVPSKMTCPFSEECVGDPSSRVAAFCEVVVGKVPVVQNVPNSHAGVKPRSCNKT